MKLLRNYIIVLAVVADVTVTLAVLSVTGHLIHGSELVVSPADPWTVQAEEAGSKDLAAIFYRVLNRADPLERAPMFPEKETVVTVQTRTSGGVFAGAYSLYVVSMINRSAFVQDLQTHEWYRLSAGDFELLFSHKLLEDTALSRYQTPIIAMKGNDWSIGSLPVTKERIFLYTPQGTFREITKESSESFLSPSEVLTLTEEQGKTPPQITGALLPDTWSVTVEKDGEPFLTQQNVAPSEIFFPSQEGEYRYNLTAHWELSPQRDWYGEVEYVLSIHIENPQPPQDLPQDSEGENVNP